jgi:hypothetical protein
MKQIEKPINNEFQELQYRKLVASARGLKPISQIFTAGICLGLVVLLISML